MVLIAERIFAQRFKQKWQMQGFLPPPVKLGNV